MVQSILLKYFWTVGYKINPLKIHSRNIIFATEEDYLCINKNRSSLSRKWYFNLMNSITNL